jgi:hypothetical protein
METNVLNAISHIVESNVATVTSKAVSLNRMNRQGEGLESFVKDSFAETLACIDMPAKLDEYKKRFSYIGSQNHPPDFMIRKGDAVEVKKVQGKVASLHLNSSYPKSSLNCDSPMITKACRDAEDWERKDLLYVVGELEAEDVINSLWMVYGDCYAADSETYEKLREAVISGIKNSALELSTTRELGKVKNVDPLGITHLRVRGMWSISSPSTVFRNYVSENLENKSRVVAVMTLKKFKSMPKESQDRLNNLSGPRLTIKEVDLPDPNNSASFIRGVVIEWLRN